MSTYAWSQTAISLLYVISIVIVSYVVDGAKEAVFTAVTLGFVYCFGRLDGHIAQRER